jgi:hypothetical protein
VCLGFVHGGHKERRVVSLWRRTTLCS